MATASTAVQGSAEWLEERLGYVTASRFADCMVQPRSKSDLLSKTAESYMIDLIGEHLTGQPASEVKTVPMEWGTNWEPVARREYCKLHGVHANTVGFIRHETEQLIGCSPDALIGEEGAIEIKCPMSAANHLRVILSGGIPDEHVPQIQGVLWVTGRQWCDFITFHPKFPEALRLLVIRSVRDEEYIERLSGHVLSFRDELQSRMNAVWSYWQKRMS